MTDQPETDAELHARRAHPDWEYATTEGPRKQWDDAGTPPADDNGDPDPTWELNTDAGRDGWDRFDYTEECYWRRLKPKPVCVHPEGYEGECPCTTGCGCCPVTAAAPLKEPAPLEIPLDAARTLHAMLGDLLAETAPAPAADRRAAYAKAIHRYDYEVGLSGNDMPSKHHMGEADAVIAVADREQQKVRAEVNAWRLKAIQRAIRLGRYETTLQALREYAAEEVTARNGWGDGYRDAMRDLTELLDTLMPPTA